MFDELQTWWQDITPETQTYVKQGGLALAALLGGHFLGSIVAGFLRARNFDRLLRLPGSSPPEGEAGRGFTPTFFAGLLVRLTVWAWAGAWFARQYGQAELAGTLGLILNRTWALAAVLVSALALGSLVAGRVVDCLQGGPRAGVDPSTARNGAASQRGLAGAVGAGVYGLVMLLALLLAADFFDWPLTRSAAQALWQLAQQLLVAGAGLLIGCLGARWARDLVASESAASSERAAGHYTALAIVAATTVLAVAVLLSSTGAFLVVAILGVGGLLLWLVRGRLPDVSAGLLLRAHKVREVWFDGVSWQLAGVGLVSTELTRQGKFGRLPNRQVLEAHRQGAPAQEQPAPAERPAAGNGGFGLESRGQRAAHSLARH